MVSEIDIGMEEECFNEIGEAESIEFNYSQSQDIRRPSRSLDRSDLKFTIHLWVFRSRD